MDLFSPAGIVDWQARLNRSAGFADSARDWTGRLLLLETEGGEIRRSAWVVVDSGRCAEARGGRPDDEAAADYVLAASANTWIDLVTARTTPATAALTGRLTLRKGDVMQLVPHAKAAAALFAAAAENSAN